MKRTICKRCDTPIIPVITSTSRIKCKIISSLHGSLIIDFVNLAKPSPSVIQTCKICKSKRRYTSQNPKYQLFSERSDVIIKEDNLNSSQTLA